MLSYCTIKGTERGAAYMAAPLLFRSFFILFEPRSSSLSMLISYPIPRTFPSQPARKPLASACVQQDQESHRLRNPATQTRFPPLYFSITSFVSSLPSLNSLILSSVVSAMLCIASAVKKAWCEVRTTLGIINKRASTSSSIILSLRSS